MKSYFNFIARRFLTVALTLTPLFPGHGMTQAADQAAPRLTIRIYDYADVDDSTLARAFDELERVYRTAGVNVSLMQCRTDISAPVLDARCMGRAGPTTVIVRVLPREMASLAATNNRVFGFAMTASRPGFGAIANAFHHQVEKLATEWGYHRGVVLGHVIAHEVGHLLLGVTSHSRRGIMQMPWNDPQLDAAHKGALVFTRRQAARIRGDVAERVRAEFGTESPGVLRVDASNEQSPTGGL